MLLHASQFEGSGTNLQQENMDHVPGFQAKEPGPARVNQQENDPINEQIGTRQPKRAFGFRGIQQATCPDGAIAPQYNCVKQIFSH